MATTTLGPLTAQIVCVAPLVALRARYRESDAPNTGGALLFLPYHVMRFFSWNRILFDTLLVSLVEEAPFVITIIFYRFLYFCD